MASHSSRAALRGAVTGQMTSCVVNSATTAPIPRFSLTDLPSCTPSAVEDLIDMLPAVLMGCLEVLQLLAEVFHVRFEVRCFCLQSLVDLACRAENEPAGTC